MPVVRKASELDYDHLETLYANKLYDDYVPKKIQSKKYESIKISADNLTYKLIDKEQRDTLCVLHGEIKCYHNVDYFEVLWSYSKYQKRGYLTCLFDLLVFEFNYKIMSDKFHTSPGSKEFWQSLIKKQDKIYRINLDTNYKRKAESYSEEEIWSVEGKLTFDRKLPDFIFDDDGLYDADESDYTNEYIEVLEKQMDKSVLDIDKEYDFVQKNESEISKERIRLVFHQ